MKNLRMILGSFVLIAFGIGNSNALAADLVWQSSKATAILMAESQNKKVLLFGGRETCGNCQYMKYTVCESDNPPIKTLIEQNYIPWFCDYDSCTDRYSYTSGLGSYTFPLICVIDPTSENLYEDRTTGVQDIHEFYSRLLQYTSDQVVIGDIDKSKKVDLTDSILALQILVNASYIEPDINADVNGDEKIGLAEAIYALQVAAKLKE